MQFFNVKIQGVTPYSQSRHHSAEKLQGESADDYAFRTWRNHMHVDKDGEVYIPSNAFKNCLSDTAKYMNISVPGKGKATYTKHFEAGIQIVEHTKLGIHVDTVEFERLFLPSDGRRGSGTRVWKYYPRIEQWGGVIQIIVLDDTVLQTSKTTGKTILEDVCVGAGQFVGLGRFRPRNNGFYGRFNVEEVIALGMARAA